MKRNKSKSIKAKLSRKGKKYSWAQIIAYAIVLILEGVWNFIMHPTKNEGKVKAFILRTGWSIANLYACAIIIAHPFILDYNLLKRALYTYPIMAAISFVIGPKESVRYLVELFKDMNDTTNSYDYLQDNKRKNIIIDIKEYKNKKQEADVDNNKDDDNDDMFYHYL